MAEGDAALRQGRPWRHDKGMDGFKMAKAHTVTVQQATRRQNL